MACSSSTGVRRIPPNLLAERNLMNQKEIKELIEFLVEKDIAEFELERGDMKIHIKRGTAAHSTSVVQVAPALVSGATSIPLMPPVVASPAPVAVPATAAATPSSGGPEAAEETDLFIVKSPIVGTFYEAPSPGAPPFVRIGDGVKEGQVLCLIEAMKLMNEIEAEVSGEIAKQFVSNNTPVEYGTALFGIRRK